MRTCIYLTSSTDYPARKSCPMKANQWAVEETLPSSDPVCLLPKKVRKLQFSRRPGFLEAVILYAALSSHSFYKGYGDVNCEVEEILQWTRVLALRLTYPLNRVSKPQFPHLWNGKSDSYPKPGSGFLAVVKVLQVKILYTLHRYTKACSHCASCFEPSLIFIRSLKLSLLCLPLFSWENY